MDLFPKQATVRISGRQYPYDRRWVSRRMRPADGYLAFDTETEVVDLRREIPRMALASASAGDGDSCLIHPDDVGKFVLAHEGLHWVAHNSSFDFWVIEAHLRGRREDEAVRAWWNIAARNRLHDSMLLDMLVRLARDDSYPDSRNLSVVARGYAGLDVSKDDPFRTRYGEILGKDWSTVEEGFFQYAIKDAIVTRPTYLAIRKQGLALVEEFGRNSTDVLPDARQRFGLLTEAIQVKKAVALAQITRNGMHIDRDWVRKGQAGLRKRLDEAVVKVRGMCPGLYKVDEAGDLILTGKAKAPSKNVIVLRGQLQKIMDEIQKEAGIEPSIPRTRKTGELSTSVKVWQEYQDHHPFLNYWQEVEGLTKLLQFFVHLQEEVVHPSYTTLVRSGRTSCSSPNVQNIPRDSMFRKAFVPSPGHHLLGVDYSFVELRTLAAHTLHRYGWSDMAEVIKQGTDPHVNTAAMMLGVSLDEFKSWKGNDTEVDGRKLGDRYDRARQAAKPVNFGVPGGLGAASLVTYARNTYKVDLSLEESRQRREALTTKVYRELELYLNDDGVAIVARNLRAPIWEARNELGDTPVSCIWKVLSGDPRRADGKSYHRTFVSRIWSSLNGLNRDPDLKEALEKRQPSPALAARVCLAGVATLTGRIRGRVRYSAARNTPFQGLAADGAALALFELIKEGVRVVGFIHDEILVELPDEGGHVSMIGVRRVEEVMCQSMESVLVGGIPVACESSLGRRWNKKAKLVIHGDRVVPWKDV